MKRLKHLAILAVTIAVYKDGVTLSSMTLPGSSFWGIEMQTLVCEDTGSVAGVDCGSTTVRAVALSTGPYTLKAASGDCYALPYINPNGTIPKTPLDWIPCP